MKNSIFTSHKYSLPSFLVVSATVILLFSISSCKKYLDLKPDKTLVVPSTLKDLQALLDNIDVMNRGYPYVGELASDDYYLTDADWSSLYLQQDKDVYNWNPTGKVTDGQWLSPYKAVYQSNLILETLNTIPVNTGNKAQWNAIKGSALFFRAYAFYELTQLFTLPYNPSGNNTSPGIPLKLVSDIYAPTIRADLQETYTQILTDLRDALGYLPTSSNYKTRPNIAAAYGELARTYLVMGDYQRAGLYADSCLQKFSTVIDYNTVDNTSPTPFQMFNPETIFYTISQGTSALSIPIAKVDPNLYKSYSANDLRKNIFYTDNGDGTFSFKGGYDGVGYGAFFNGLATDEILLIRAECAARTGNVNSALSDLNTLLKQRYKAGLFNPISAVNADDALIKILTERRKELAFRGIRWSDLRRLNLDSRFAITISRTLNGKTYQLLPNDLRYAFLIPDEVISQSGIDQNKR